MPAANPFVSYLARYTTASPDHEAAFDEFLARTPPPTGKPLRLATRVEAFLKARFSGPNPPSVILTGNAGDGKTYLCRQVLAAFGEPKADWDALAERPVERGALRLHVVKDLSELGDEHGLAVLRELAAALAGTSPDRYLIAANEGRLRHLLSEAGDQALYATVDQQLKNGVDAGADLAVINLTKVTTSAFVTEALAWMTGSEHWEACQACPISERCPVRANARRLGDPHVARRVQLLYELLEHLDIHVTVRDMLIHLAYTLTGDQRCHELQRLDAAGRDLSGLAYYSNVWGGDEQSPFRRKATVVQHLGRLRVGEHSLFEIDDFVVNAATTDEHRRIFAPAVDLNFKRFAQDRAAYIEGGAERLAGDEAKAMLRWLPHCRRKLFFEWRDTARANRLVVFQSLDDYLRLLNDERDRHDEVRARLILGLNRAFSRLYLTDSANLYVTSQYLHSAEQSRPLVRLTIPASGIMLRVDPRDERAYDRAWPDLYLVIGAPSALTLVDPAAAGRKQLWRLNLLLFEYLTRLADGGTYNVLAEECELSVRDLKDRLLGAFGREPQGGDQIEFFVAERRKYALKKLRIDDQGTIRTGG